MNKRLFFAFNVSAPWQEIEPKGRLIDKNLRHMTVLFLGDVMEEKIDQILKSLFIFDKKIGLAGLFDKILFLPKFRANVIAYRMVFFDDIQSINNYRTSLIQLLDRLEISHKDFKSFLPHVTLCRRPFEIREWKKNFEKLPFFISSVHLYESEQNSNYISLWHQDFIAPFEEIEHTADLAFKIRGNNYNELYLNGFIALAFKYSKLCDFFTPLEKVDNLDDVIIALNVLIEKMDIKIGSPFKAVSFQSKLEKKAYLEWEMIVDV